MSNTFNAFNDLLRSRARKYSENADELGSQPGAKALTVSGVAVQILIFSGLVNEWLDQVFEQLPPDAAIQDIDGVLLSRIGQIDENGRVKPTNNYSIIFVSREWPTTPQTSPIPDLELAPFAVLPMPSEPTE